MNISKQLKLINYQDICEVKDFKQYEKGILPKNRFNIVQKPEKTKIINPIIPSQQAVLEQQIPQDCTSKQFYLASIKDALCLKNQTIVYKNQFLLPDSFRHYDPYSFHLFLKYNQATNRFCLKENPTKVIWQTGDIIFLSGEISGAYGHFLLEVVSRLWITQFIDISKYKFIMNPNDTKQWQLDILKAIGIRPNQIIRLHYPVRCERLHIPVQAFVLRKYTSTLANATWGKIGDYYDEGVGPKKIYVSRSKLNNNRRCLVNEQEVEKLFSSYGFTIIHPQELSVSKQINIFRNANIVAGSSGSAMYNCIFQNKPTKKLILTPRQFFKKNDILINSHNKGQLNYFIGKTIDTNIPANRADWLVNLAQLKKYLTEYLKGVL
ncbi:glycosyltransferase family 61 protein [Halalkalibacter alkalisediminis]|uniref:DUF563 domain-containing protein n=1 Tax=Halalkalibacter alkalisediminis TaxID=935616 RepID=A0ABV6NPG4_9BACI|nr:glycosyltransferase 61 family protein [Halalkalibacter alkalisediminis]